MFKEQLVEAVRLITEMSECTTIHVDLMDDASVSQEILTATVWLSTKDYLMKCLQAELT